jgi:hypothetical protein
MVYLQLQRENVPHVQDGTFTIAAQSNSDGSNAQQYLVCCTCKCARLSREPKFWSESGRSELSMLAYVSKS